MTDFQCRLAQIERELQISLPDPYRYFLLRHHGRDRYADSKYPSRHWRFATVTPQAGDADQFLTIDQPVTIGDRTIPFERSCEVIDMFVDSELAS